MTEDIIYQIAKAGGQLAVLVQDLSDVEGLGDEFKAHVHKLVCTIEDLERRLHFAEKWSSVLDDNVILPSCDHKWEYVYHDDDNNPVKRCTDCGRHVRGIRL